MNRIDIIKRNISEEYKLLAFYEEDLVTADDPKRIMRNEKAIADSKRKIKDWHKELEYLSTKPAEELTLYNNQNVDLQFEYDFFLSFSSRNIDTVYQIYEVFQRYQLRVFISEITLKSLGGTSFFDKINQALNGSKHFVLLCTPEAMQSQWVKTEFQAFYHNFTMHNPDSRKFFVMRGPGFHHSLVPLLLSVIQLVDNPEQIIRSLNIKPIKEIKKAVEPIAPKQNTDEQEAERKRELELQDALARQAAEKEAKLQKQQEELKKRQAHEALLKQQADDQLKALQAKQEAERKAEQERLQHEEEEKQKAKALEIERKKAQEAEKLRIKQEQKAAELRKQETLELQKEQVELKHWQTAINSNALADFKNYLRLYPKGKFADQAKQFVQVLENGEPQIPVWVQYKKQLIAIGSIAAFVLLIVIFNNIFNGKAEEATEEEVTDEAVTGEEDTDIPEFTEPEMMFVKGGTFTMGSTDGEADEKPTHQVTLSDFYIGKYEVTQKQWKAVMGTNPSNFKGDNLPVETVSWNDVQEFIKKLNAKTGKKYALPTEAQWEYAAGGGANNRTKWAGTNNENELKDYAWYDSNSGSTTHEVGTTKKANSLGIYDMSGNVWEWCLDWYDSGYYKNSPQKDPVNLTAASGRVLRGGSWRSYARSCRSADRYNYDPDYRYIFYGFRLTRTN